MNLLFSKVFVAAVVIFLLFFFFLRPSGPCGKYAAIPTKSVDSAMFSTVTIVNSHNFSDTELADVFRKIEKDFPMIILTASPMKAATSAFDLSRQLDESLAACDNNILGFYVSKFFKWLKFVEIDTTGMPHYSYMNYLDTSKEILTTNKSSYSDFNFYQMIVIVGDIEGGSPGRDFFYLDNDSTVKLYRPQLLASMFYSIVKREFIVDVPQWINFMIGIMMCLIFSLVSLSVKKFSRMRAYFVYKLLHLGLAIGAYLIAFVMVYQGSKYIIDVGYLFVLILIGGEIVYWIPYLFAGNIHSRDAERTSVSTNR